MVVGYIHGWYGFGSSWIILAFVALALIRGFTMRRRRGMGPRRPGMGGPWGAGMGPMSSAAPTRNVAVKDLSPDLDIDHQGVAAGWFPDPSGRYDQRYWSGSAWTEHVMKDGAPAVDPPPARPPKPDGEPVEGAGSDRDPRETPDTEA